MLRGQAWRLPVSLAGAPEAFGAEQIRPPDLKDQTRQIHHLGVETSLALGVMPTQGSGHSHVNLEPELHEEKNTKGD